ncbi:PBP1A family penicillin-binding protein [Cohnella sp. CFH 77786]|uniref:transglycosylase domain-containing protein n=1 Tax=Cohnella sp. CFH 77786 TaxID=2662265 RepID=UPI001C6111E3|nr:PBP1A family penicillin-binding protein [Cohnella sp. CFH 77786]MBW5448194.1 PBP1A family penicillin-binding protein [Cohnella sp. CFH 77786]
MQERPATGRAAAGNRGGGQGGKKQAPRKRSKKRGLLWLFFVVLLGIVCAIVGYLLIILNGERILSENLNKLNLDQASLVVDKNGKEVAKLSVAEGNREYVPINQIPKLVQQAFVATEDKRFYEHGGVDLFGIGRALVKDIIHRSAKEGASTITQQVARNIFLNADKTLFRKGTEASIALALERHKSKDEILELYLNRIYFGKGQYGIKTAAKYYFNKDITSKDPKQQLQIWEIATLAAMPKAPSTYNPISNPDKSKERRAVVLSLMQEQGLITAEQAEAAKKVDYNPNVVPKSNKQYQSFIDYVVDEAQAVTDLSEEELLTGGYTIKTTIDTKAQQAMENVYKNDNMFEKSKDEVQIQSAMVIMDQHDGSLVAMIGGRDYEKNGWNRATKPRQPGSSFKPIATYGPAIETGNYFPWSILRDDKVCYNNGKYCPTDSNKVKYLGPVTMTQAIQESRNQPAVWLLNEIGVKKGLDFAEKLGIELDSEQDRNLAIALGGLTHGASPLQMARAYGAFANGGILEDPHSILSITNKHGDTVYEFKQPKPQRVMKPETAYYVTQLLQSVTQPGGTGTRARISGRTVVGKTGTTQHGIPGLPVNAGGNRDVWFVGYTPELTAAVWVGYDNTDKNHLVRQSSGQAAALFSAVMSKALEGKPKKSFPKPEGIVEQAPEVSVSGLTAAYSEQTVSVELKWTAQNAKAGTSYRVYRKAETESAFTMLVETPAPDYEDYAIFPDQTYTYYVTAYDPETKQESKPSEQVSVTIASGAVSPSPSPTESPVPGDAGGTDEGGGAEEGGGENPELPIPSTPPGGEQTPGGESPPPPSQPADGPSASPSPSEAPVISLP